jgi:hypothetical protein
MGTDLPVCQKKGPMRCFGGSSGIDANLELLFEGTIKLVKTSAAFLNMGRRRHIDPFLAMQAPIITIKRDQL